MMEGNLYTPPQARNAREILTGRRTRILSLAANP